LLGVGPDNFRHLYGAELGLDSWDERVQANNLLIEVLVDTGILGLAAFAWVIVRPLRAARRAIAGADGNYLVLGITLGVLAFLIHGLLDVFLTYTPTTLLFWLLLGLLSAQKPQVSGR
jgi:O-antigen ligase